MLPRRIVAAHEHKHQQKLVILIKHNLNGIDMLITSNTHTHTHTHHKVIASNIICYLFKFIQTWETLPVYLVRREPWQTRETLPVYPVTRETFPVTINQIWPSSISSQCAHLFPKLLLVSRETLSDTTLVKTDIIISHHINIEGIKPISCVHHYGRYHPKAIFPLLNYFKMHS